MELDMKKHLSLILALILVVSAMIPMFSCGPKEPADGADTTTEAPETTTPAPETTTPAPETTTPEPVETTTEPVETAPPTPIGPAIKVADATPISNMEGELAGKAADRSIEYAYAVNGNDYTFTIKGGDWYERFAIPLTGLEVGKTYIVYFTFESAATIEEYDYAQFGYQVDVRGERADTEKYVEDDKWQKLSNGDLSVTFVAIDEPQFLWFEVSKATDFTVWENKVLSVELALVG